MKNFYFEFFSSEQQKEADRRVNLAYKELARLEKQGKTIFDSETVLA